MISTEQVEIRLDWAKTKEIWFFIDLLPIILLIILFYIILSVLLPSNFLVSC
jgi:hypothetical protein